MKKYFLIAIALVLGLQAYAQLNIGGDNATMTPVSGAPFFLSPIGHDTANRNNPANLIGAGIYFPQVDLTQVTSFGINLAGSALPGSGHMFRTFLDGFVVYNIGTGPMAANAAIGNVEGGVFTPGFWFYDNTVGINLQPGPGVNNALRLNSGTWRPLGGGGGGAGINAWLVGGNTKTVDTPQVLGVSAASTEAPPIIVYAGDNGERRAIMRIGR